MTATRNLETLQRLDIRNPEACAHLFTEDFVWHYVNPARPDLHGDYVGLAGLGRFFEALSAMSDATFAVAPQNAWPMGDELVAVHTRNSFAAEDGHHDFDAAVIWRFRDGKVAEVWDIPSIFMGHPS